MERMLRFIEHSKNVEQLNVTYNFIQLWRIKYPSAEDVKFVIEKFEIKAEELGYWEWKAK